jgi:hypothetical protein
VYLFVKSADGNDWVIMSPISCVQAVGRRRCEQCVMQRWTTANTLSLHRLHLALICGRNWIAGRNNLSSVRSIINDLHKCGYG